jgi:4-amino-4-deoxy-L-arabinose transferase-like glycosyltransferase
VKKKAPWLLLGVLIVQLGLTGLVFFPAPHTGGDNAGYVSLAHSLVERGAYLELWDHQEPPHTKYPPVFPLLLAGAMALGVKGWVGLKAVPFLFTLLSGAFAFLWIRDRKGEGAAAAVALLLVMSDAVLYYSHWILSDPVFLAFTLGALWALERGDRREAQRSGLWVLGGFALVLLAYFTRSAGLPLVVATVLWLLLKKGWRALAIFSGAYSILGGLWWWRGRVGVGSGYVSEFWLIDPYRPELGQVGPTDLLARVWGNLVSYTTALIPEGIVGLEGPLLLPLGLAVVALAMVGWAMSWKVGRAVAEYFFPLYAGLMLLWPEVWSGDRFALPLLPLILFYAASALHAAFRGLGPSLRTLLLAAAFLLLALPSLKSWTREMESAQACLPMAMEGNPWACHGMNVQEYVLLAEWAGENLPLGSVVVTRKPRIFFVQSSVKTRSLPLTTDPESFLATAREGGGGYLTADRWDGLSAYYLPSVLGSRPDAFCYLTGVEAGGEVGIRLLGLRPDGEGGGSSGLPQCPPEMVRTRPWPRDAVGRGQVPLLVWGNRTR